MLDEPTSGLDVQSAKLIKDSIRNLNSSGMTVFLTTHNMEEANQLCNRVAIIDKGSIVAIGKPEELKRTIRQVHSVEVSFDRAFDLSALSAIDGVMGLEKLGEKIRLRTEEPGSLACSLVDFARSKNLKVISLTTSYPTMEDVFLEYTNGDRNGRQ
jgi:ABC-2 type transport system ATP-binding protein